MKVIVNLELTDEELRKYAADVGRRWITDGIHSVIQHVPALKPPPGFFEGIFGLIQTIRASESQPQAPDSTPPRQSQPQPRVDANQSPHPKCARVFQDHTLDDGWICCRCSTYNGLARTTCRACDTHERCDIVITPPPEVIPPEPPA